MLAFWRKRDPVAEAATRLYAAAVAHAREPAFYRDLGVPDTYEGRFEMIIVSVFALMHRLLPEGEAGHKLSQATMETMFMALDDDMREIGVGDMTVPKKVIAAASAFYGRAKVYSEALDDPAKLAAGLHRNVMAGAGDASQGLPLARHLITLLGDLTAQPVADLLLGTVRFPAPVVVSDDRAVSGAAA